MLLSHTLLRRSTILRNTLLSTSTLTSTLQSRPFATKRRRRPNPFSSPPSSSSSNAPSPSSLFDNQGNTPENTNATPGSLPGLTEAYAPTHPQSGKLMTMEEYKNYAKLSPWVPCPDIVARRMLEIAETKSNDVHVELGCGDGRLNFHAIDSPFFVKYSTGIDIDPTLVGVAMDRLGKRHPIPTNVSFLEADLLLLQKKEYKEVAEQVKESIENSTVLTMYFVEEALQQIKPMLETYLKQNTACRVVTCGYEMKGWKPSWAEVVLGLPIYLYKMDRNVGGPEKLSLIDDNAATNEKMEMEELKPVRPSGDVLPKPEEQPLIPEGEDVDIDDDEDWDAGFDDDGNAIEDGSSSGGGSVGGGSRGWMSDKR